ncbi:MAG: response regulator [Desulfobacteraceae bacterium]|nr:response regulator [Desulfobacteraceae bacterium]
MKLKNHVLKKIKDISIGEGIISVRKILFESILAIFGILGLLAVIMGGVEVYLQGKWQLGFVYICAYLPVLACLLFRKKISYLYRVGIVLLDFYILSVLILAGVGLSGAGISLLITFSVLATTFLGIKMGLISVLMSFIGILLIGLAMSTGMIPIDITTMTNSTRIEAWFMAATLFIFIGSIMVVCPGILQNSLQRTIELIQEKTLELKKANKLLQKALKEREEMEAQVIQAEKMEAMGRLSACVAHDLNNVLSAQVGYPDLILMDLPENSPLKEPILRIQESGQKAAAIVQDLLTMARRGVVVTDVINLNHIIDNYLHSPECERLKRFHPDVIIKNNLNPDLLNIMGSTVHLFKTIMNLTSNAAEAMPHGGNIVISTQNQYIDKPIKGYNSFKEGDYSVLRVSDTGTGIAPKDIERIFEPFYTKKVMGKSGTGLGMAVVWGTIKDHNGYIDVQSTQNKGTIFTLYFPITREEISETTALPMEEYMGKGESILVVDDTEGQRKVASDLLKKLGYSVTSVAGGEQAVDYMKKRSANLIILDMIMDPGIDGCETYKQILELYPEQKAIITSGFSETARVKETQKLGAGEYLKKPYTLEKLGFSVKKELAKE